MNTGLRWNYTMDGTLKKAYFFIMIVLHNVFIVLRNDCIFILIDLCIHFSLLLNLIRNTVNGYFI